MDMNTRIESESRPGEGSAVATVTKFVSYDNVRIEYFADGQGPLIVFLPSLGRDAEDYEKVASLIVKQGFRVLRPQPRGIGASTGPMDKINIHDLARDVTAVIENENAGPAFVCGHAYGNLVARVVACDRPELVRAVALMAAAARGPIEPGLRATITKSADLTLSDEERIEALRTVFFAKGNDASVWLGGWNLNVALAQRAASDAVPQEEFWHAGTAPILEIRAANDPLEPENKKDYMQQMYGNRVTQVEIANSGHALVPEQPEALAAVIVLFARMIP